MKLFGLLLLIGLAAAAPPTKDKDDDKIVVTSDFFPDQLSVYTSKHDIVNIFVPLNAINFDESEDDDSEDDSSTVLFFVEADIKDGVKDYKGLYVLKKGNATLLLENGRDATATNDNTTLTYFGATDGLYSYDVDNNKAIKYGTVTDSIISLAQGVDAAKTSIYILTEDKQLFKVTENGTKKEKIDDVENVEQFVLDSSNNIYYYSHDKKPYVKTVGAINKIEGLPEKLNEVTLLRPPFIIEDGVPFIVDNKVYIIYSNGTSELTDFEFEVKPSAYSIEATLIQYYAYEKKIYEYNILALVLSEVVNELKKFFDEKKNDIQSIASRSRDNLRASI